MKGFEGMQAVEERGGRIEEVGGYVCVRVGNLYFEVGAFESFHKIYKCEVGVSSFMVPLEV